ncbi:dTDP-4-dehydrorhamnose reductase family protein [Peribacillus asahii]|uniref:dTDP-4-dehydrorhamnose reductase family protein n=1 Tax=Peribacillus asahii TaxID=228899 RepID=UPI0020794B17|nr:SDR family oxidoreductase [Peribacillus asahii]USK69967.1 SDR family oxidoreductase [Peribacillus asahii]
MKVLLTGATGMLGQALYEAFMRENVEVITVARSNSHYNIDLIVNSEKIIDVIQTESPDIVINSAALINLQACEDNPKEAYFINAKLPGILTEACREVGCFFVQISTDHYYMNDSKKKHSEKDPVLLVNEYARTKYEGERFALTYANSLIVRTNIVGFRNKKNTPTFIEWIIDSLNSGKKIYGFEDFYTSSIDVYHFSDILIELIEKRITGILNIASTNVLSKYEFISELASVLNKESFVKKGNLNQFKGIKRANSLGLDVTKLKTILGNQEIPSSQEVIHKVVEKYREGAFYEL